MMFDDDDDDSELRFNVVDKYYFEEGDDGNPVCFSVLPLKFDELGEVAYLDSKKVDLQGLADDGLLRVHKEVVAWRVGLNYDQPKILVLSSEGKWIELLNPRKCYEKTVRSILIIVQMLHFVKKWPRKRKRSLFDHLCEVFNKFDTKPAEYDLKKHSSIIKLFAEKDSTLMKSKILQMFTENTTRNIREPTLQGVRTKEPNVVSSSDEEEDLDNDSDDDYSGQEDNIDADYSCDDDNSDDQGNGDDKSNDDYSCNDDNDDDGDIDNDGDGDDDDDGDIDNDCDDDGGTDNLCAICDNGGKLLSCEGPCKRAFHPREKDGIESNCETLGLTTAQLKEIDHYLCKNCEYKQHQCFSCGDLEPSDGPNAKVFQCYKASCGHFYHPSCITKLLEPDDTDGACKLEKKIAAGMSFTCPVHWCSKCGKMEDSAHKAQWLAVCRRCPVSYHKKCLPSTIPLEAKRGRRVRAWQLDDRIIMYCGRHKIEETIGTPCRDRVKLPSITEMDTIGSHCMVNTPVVAEIDRTRDLSKKKAEVTGKRKMNTDQGSPGTTEMSNKLCREEADQTQKVAMNNSREHISREGRGVPKKDTTHLDMVHNDEQDNFIMQEQAEGDKNNTKSGEEEETHRVESAYDHDLILEKEKIPEKESNKSGLTIEGFTSGHVDGRSREKLADVKTTTSNRIGTQQDCKWNGGQQFDGSYTGKQELKNSQCNDTHKATEIDTSGDKSRMRKEHKEQETDSKIPNLDRNKGKCHMKTGRDGHCKAQGPQCLHNHKEPDALDKFRNRDLSSSSTAKSHPLHDDDQRALTTESKSRDGRGSGRHKGDSSLERRCHQKRSRDHSPEGGYSQKSSRVCSPKGRPMDYHYSHPRSNDQHRYERRRSDDYSSDGGDGRRRLSRREGYSSDGDRRRHPRDDYSSEGDGDRRMLSRHEDYRSDGDVGRRRLSPRHSEVSPRNFSSMPVPLQIRQEHSMVVARHGPPSYGGRHDPYMNSSGSEHVDYAMGPSVPFQYAGPEYGRYNAMDMAPDFRYSRHEVSAGAYGPPTDAGMGEQAAFYGAGFRDYGEGSGFAQTNTLNSENRALAAESVTDRYAPRLDQTNHPIRSQGGLHDAWRHQSL